MKIEDALWNQIWLVLLLQWLSKIMSQHQISYKQTDLTVML